MSRGCNTLFCAARTLCKAGDCRQRHTPTWDASVFFFVSDKVSLRSSLAVLVVCELHGCWMGMYHHAWRDSTTLSHLSLTSRIPDPPVFRSPPKCWDPDFLNGSQAFYRLSHLFLLPPFLLLSPLFLLLTFTLLSLLPAKGLGLKAYAIIPAMYIHSMDRTLTLNGYYSLCIPALVRVF